MPMDIQFWQGKKVLVTGHTGFKGSWLTLWLHQLGARCYGIALPPLSTSLYQQADVDTLIDSRLFSITDLSRLREAVSEIAPDIILHLAAQPLVRESYSDPVGTYAVNVMGTVNLLEVARSLPSVRAVLVVTSDKCYENREWLWGYRENEPMGGHDPYSNSKGCAELVVSAFRRSFFSDGRCGLATARAGNVIGGGDWAADRLIPDAVRCWSAGQALAIRRPDAVRPWQHVHDLLRGYLILAQRLYQQPDQYAEAWNFGPADGDTASVRHVVSQLAAVWGEGAAWHEQGDNNLHEAGLLRLDSSRARTLLQWRPQLDLTEALAQTVRWYQAARSQADMQQLCIDEIQAVISAESAALR